MSTAVGISARSGLECDEVLTALKTGWIGPVLVVDVDTNEGEVFYDTRLYENSISFEELMDALKWCCDYLTEDDRVDAIIDAWSIDRIQKTIFQRIAEAQ